jgi:hypothetical protein
MVISVANLGNLSTQDCSSAFTSWGLWYLSKVVPPGAAPIKDREKTREKQIQKKVNFF